MGTGASADSSPAPKLSSWIWTFLWASATGAAFDSAQSYTEICYHAGSHTTQRLKGEAEINIAHPLVREHRPVWSRS